MKSFALTLILIFSVGFFSVGPFGLGSTARAEINSSGVLGFQAWKTSRIDETRATLDKIQTEAQVDKPQAARPVEAKKAYQKFQQAQLNVQIALELSISDYFTLYLSQLKDRSMMLDAARKLSAEEIADLMVAYQKAVSPLASSSAAEMTLPLLAPVRSSRSQN